MAFNKKDLEVAMEEEPRIENKEEEKNDLEKRDKRHGCERRLKKSLGHMYITTVGWICRREKDRRSKECKE